MNLLKHMDIRATALLLATALLCGSIFCPVAAETEEQVSQISGDLYVAAAEGIPEYQWQKKAVFPDWKGYTDDTLAMNSMISFQSRHGQGTLWFSVSEEVESFVLYVNGSRCDTVAVTAGTWAVDISGTAVDGVNTLQISNILRLL